MFVRFQDIEYALKAGYSGTHFEQLEQRRRQAKKAKEKQAEVPYHQPIPPLSFPAHRHIECAADCVKIRKNATYGRHVVASRDIPVASVIAVEKPFAQALLTTKFLTHCYHCLRPSHNLVTRSLGQTQTHLQFRNFCADTLRSVPFGAVLFGTVQAGLLGSLSQVRLPHPRTPRRTTPISTSGVKNGPGGMQKVQGLRAVAISNRLRGPRLQVLELRRSVYPRS